MDNHLSTIIIFFAYTAIISFIIYKLFLRYTNLLQLRKTNFSGERWASQGKPIYGGIPFYIMFVLAIANYGLFFDTNAMANMQFWGIFSVISLSFFMGLADDKLSTNPGFKFLIQVFNGIILIYTGTYIELTGHAWADHSLTVFWVVAIMNSVNMLDNMDAITASNSLAILLGGIVILLLGGGAPVNGSSGTLLFIMAGAVATLLSFLVFNWHPSRMYMGDNGSQFLGALLAIVGIACYWNTETATGLGGMSKNAILTALAFVIPITDTTTVTINRLLRGRSPFVGGRDHTTHHLHYAGLKERGIALLLMSISIICTGISVSLVLWIEQWTLGTAIASALPFLLVLVSLYSLTKISKPPQKEKEDEE